MKSFKLVLGSALLIALSTTAAFAAGPTVVTLPDEATMSSSLSADVSEQCSIEVPTTINFDVKNIAVDTLSGSQDVTIKNIVLASALTKLKLSIQADAAGFTTPNGGTTWVPADIAWTAATWSGDAALTGTGSAGTALANDSFQTVATSAATSSVCSTTNLVFTLKKNESVTRSGSHTLAVTWKVESI